MEKKRWPTWVRRLFRLVRPRSRGVPVSRAVMRLIWVGDAARRTGDWPAAAKAFGAALAKAPHLGHLWVQYGHMLREAGRREEAREAYDRALILHPHEREPYHLLIELARAAGDRADVLRLALAVFRLDPADAHARLTLLQALSADQPGHAGPLDEIGAAIGLSVPAIPRVPVRSTTLFIDVGDLIAHFARSRLPSGLQRVEMEVARAALSRIDLAPELCSWSMAADGWKPLPGNAFLSLIEAAASDLDDAEWRRHLTSTLFALASSSPIAFPPGATLLTLGMAWHDPLYYPAVAREKARSGLRFAAIACDVIPLVRPGEVPADIVLACGHWLDALADVADAIVAISSATREEVVTVSRARGKPIPADRIGVVPLDATFGTTQDGRTDILARHGLAAGGFALYVSTIEPRKNHVAVLNAWQRLLTGGMIAVPDLVCVGRRGWRSERVDETLSADRGLARRVHLLDRVTDDDLDTLYEGCAFVLYPSLHEGWGLPVTEALARGKVPVIGRNSSLPEAGGRFAVYVDATSPADMAATIRRLLRDPAELTAREAAIRDGFHPRGWREIADDMVAVALRGAP